MAASGGAAVSMLLLPGSAAAAAGSVYIFSLQVSCPSLGLSSQWHQFLLGPLLYRYIHIPGHAPGHLALLHQPSSTLLPGDAVIPSLASRLLPGVNCLSVPAGISSSCPDTVKPRAKQLLEQVRRGS